MLARKFFGFLQLCSYGLHVSKRVPGLHHLQSKLSRMKKSRKKVFRTDLNSTSNRKSYSLSLGMTWYCFDNKKKNPYYNRCAHRLLVFVHFTFDQITLAKLILFVMVCPVHRKMYDIISFYLTFSVETMYDTHFTKYFVQSLILNDSLAHRQTSQTVNGCRLSNIISLIEVFRHPHSNNMHLK